MLTRKEKLDIVYFLSLAWIAWFVALAFLPFGGWLFQFLGVDDPTIDFVVADLVFQCHTHPVLLIINAVVAVLCVFVQWVLIPFFFSYELTDS